MSERIAAVDIGTNTVRLAVKELPEKKTIVRKTMITRLGRGVDSSGALSPKSIELTLSALIEYSDILRSLEVDDVSVVATSATRDATNSEEFLGSVRELLGHKVRVITGEEEGKLAYLGAVFGLPDAAKAEEKMVLDIGGGSTELIWGREKPEGVRSLNIGAVRLTEKFLHTDPPLKNELEESLNFIREKLAGEVSFLKDKPRRLIAVAGTPTTVVAMKLELEKYDPELVNGYILTRENVDLMFRKMVFLTNLGRLHVRGLEPARADVIVAGIQILLEVMEYFETRDAMVSEYDLLDGIIEEHLNGELGLFG